MNDYDAARLEDIRIANAQPDGPFRWPDGAIVFSDTWQQWWTWQAAGAPHRGLGRVPGR